MVAMVTLGQILMTSLRHWLIFAVNALLAMLPNFAKSIGL